MEVVELERVRDGSKSDVRVAARRAVLEAQSERRRARQEREERLTALAVEVSYALRSAAAAVAEGEARAGRALDDMVGMGLNVSEVVEWCAGDVNIRDVVRLRRAALEAPGLAPDQPARIGQPG